MVVGDTYIYSGKGFSHTAIKKIRDGGIIELGHSSWKDDEQWIEVLENNFFVGFINGKTKLIDLNNYCYIIEDDLFCFEKPDLGSEITVCLKRHDKIYLISKTFTKGQLWIKIYDSHGYCCYIDGNSKICPNKFIPYSTTLMENTIMYIASIKKNIYKTILLKKKSRLYVKGLVVYKSTSGLETNFQNLFTDTNLKAIYNSENLDYLFYENKANYVHTTNFLNNLEDSDDVWLEIHARGLTGYIPAITKTNSMPHIDHLPNEYSITNSSFCDYNEHNKLKIPGILSLVLGLIIFSLLPSFSVFAFYLWVLGICLIILKYFCS